MGSTTNPKGKQTPKGTTAGSENGRIWQKQHRIQYVLWVIGLIIFAISCVIIHFHPAPYPADLSTTETVQGLHTWPWVNAVIDFPSTLNNPVPSAVALGVWFFGMLIMGLISRLRGKSPVTWLQSAAFLVLTVMSSAGVNVLVDDIVARPRPDPHIEPIHVYTPIVPFPTYPSGHSEHDIAYYGFLLYLSFTKPVRQWRYRWLLLPLQAYAIFDILVIGYSRVLEGDHWVTDVLGGYLEGLLLLFFFIFLYRWTTNVLVRWRAKKEAEKSSAAYSVR